MARLADVIAALPQPAHGPGWPLPAPRYLPPAQPGVCVGLAVEDMRHHMTDEGWQLFLGLADSGYDLAGHNLEINETHVPDIIRYVECWRGRGVQTVVVQDKREWDVEGKNFRLAEARFTGVNHLARRDDVFRLTVLKDAHQRPVYHAESASEIGCHGWITYYHPKIVCHLAPYMRPEHVVRTYHTVDPDTVPPYAAAGRRGCLLSGALSNAYPLRRRLAQHVSLLPYTTWKRHPGYHRNGCQTPAFLHELSQYRVALCTASIYGYVLRKMIEATACGCVVITDLPEDEVVPRINGNLLRVPPDISMKAMARLVRHVHNSYDAAKQHAYALRALDYYSYQKTGARLAFDIEKLRRNYP